MAIGHQADSYARRFRRKLNVRIVLCIHQSESSFSARRHEEPTIREFEELPVTAVVFLTVSIHEIEDQRLNQRHAVTEEVRQGAKAHLAGERGSYDLSFWLCGHNVSPLLQLSKDQTKPAEPGVPGGVPQLTLTIIYHCGIYASIFPSFL
ncbi:hypothetical protein MBHK15_60038 [Marinobacter salarius]|nr:hypothetical protein MBHK15_60038 [Marinobacter salarius]